MRYIRLSAVLLLAACVDGEPTAPPTPVATSITLSATTLSFASLGETQELHATVKDIEDLESRGMGRLFGPGTPTTEIIDYIQDWFEDQETS